MRPDGLERHSAGSGPLHRLDERTKLLATLGFIVAVIAAPFRAGVRLAAKDCVWRSRSVYQEFRHSIWHGGGWGSSCSSAS